MRNNIKYQYIKRGLTQKNSAVTKIAITTIVSVIVLFLFLFLINSNEMSTIKQVYKTFGKYTVSIPKESGKDYSKLYKDNQLEDYLELRKIELNDKGIDYEIYNADEKILDFINVEILDGSYPQSDNEILLERKYLFSLGFDENEMVGATIQINNNNYTVSGVIIKNEAQTDKFDYNKYVCILNKKTKDNPNTILLQLKDMRNYKTTLDSYVIDYNINKEECYINFDLFMSLGYTLDEDPFVNNRVLYYGMYTIVLTMVLLSMGNYMKTWINSILPNISNMNLLGVPQDLLRKALLNYFITKLIKFITISFCLSLLISYILLKTVYVDISAKEAFLTYPYITFLSSIILFCILLFYKQFRVTRIVEKIDPIIVTHNSKGIVLSNSYRFKKHIFNFTTRFYRWKICKHNISFSKYNYAISIFGIAITIAIYCVGSFYLTANSKVFGHDVDMDYKVQFKPDYLQTEKEYKENTELYNSLETMNKDVVLYPTYIEFIDSEIDRESLNKSYIQYIAKIQSNNLLVDYENDSKIKVRVAVLGYTDEQIEELYEINNKEYKKILNDEIIILENTVPLRGDTGFELNFKKDQMLNLQDISGKEYRIVDTVEKLSVYLSETYNTICIIVNEETYKKRNNLDFPPEFYLKFNKDADVTSVKSKLIGNPLVEISIPKEEERLLKESTKILKRIIIGVVLIIILSIVNSIYSNLLLRYNTNINEYRMLNLLGLSKKDSIIIWLYELLSSIGGAMLISIPIVFFSTYIVQIIMLNDIARYIYSFPINDYFAVASLLLILSAFISAALAKKIKSIKVIRE